jgi:hypothetical protein
VSLSWREKVRISVAPHQVALVRFGRSGRGAIADRKALDVDRIATTDECGSPVAKPTVIETRCVDTAIGVRKETSEQSTDGVRNVKAAAGSFRPDLQQPAWLGAIDALGEMLAHPNINRRKSGRIEASVILSSEFVRYLVMPFSTQLITPREEMDFARMRFQQIYGEAVNQWQITVSPSPAGMNRVCAAVDGQLVEALSHVIAGSPFRLDSIQPALMSQFNTWRRQIGDNAWLVLAEHARVVIARIDRGEWRSVRSRAIGEAPIPLAQWLAQEQLLLDVPATAVKVCLGVMDDVAVDTEGVQVQKLSPRARAGFAPPADGELLLAMAGVE